MKLLLALLLVCSPVLRAAEPFLKPNDVIALVGGEDMVAAAEYGYLELLLQRALPEHRLKVRSLAWEGDTVFEQPRDLNYPTLEAQLEEVGATVVILQFGQMESLAGTSKLPEFIQAYEKLIERLGAGGKRRVVLVQPTRVEWRSTQPEAARLMNLNRRPTEAFSVPQLDYSVVPDIASRNGCRQVQCRHSIDHGSRDGFHASEEGHKTLAQDIADSLGADHDEATHRAIFDIKVEDGYKDEIVRSKKALAAIRAKNRLWFHYYRPQNWAFLAGDRTEQPSSRDHKDPSKRWFPEEMKQWLGLIDAKEKEIWALAAKAAKP